MEDHSLKIFRPIHINGLKRLGNAFDGGYIVHYPSLKDADCLLNYGVGYNVKFEEDFFKETGLPTLAFDPTLTSLGLVFGDLKSGMVPFLRHVKKYIYWIFKQPTLKKSKIEFIEEGIAEKDTQQYKSLRYHFNKYNLFDKKIILKMDVEGYEYPILNDPAVYELLPNAIQILMEIHYVSEKIENLIEIMKKVSKTHSLVHIHSNNHAGTFKYKGKDVPEAMEVTFLLNEYIRQTTYTTETYPINGLDQPCDRLKEDIVLDFFY
jgi:hypothetical protein